MGEHHIIAGSLIETFIQEVVERLFDWETAFRLESIIDEHSTTKTAVEEKRCTLTPE